LELALVLASSATIHQFHLPPFPIDAKRFSALEQLLILWAGYLVILAVVWLGLRHGVNWA